MITLRELATHDFSLLVAHRGSSGTSPENSLLAFSEAVAAGADMLEIDIQFTKDSAIVAYHDLIPHNLPKPVEDMSYRELSKIDLFGKYDQKFSETRIPRLEEIIELALDKTYLLIELKKPSESKEHIRKLVKMIDSKGMMDFTLFASFDRNNISLIKEISPEANCAVIKYPYDPTLPSKLKEKLNFEAFICALDEITPELIEDTKQSGIFIGVYAVDSPGELRKALDFGVKAIGTNYPAKMLQSMRELGLKS
jgi:glycerophosphoryl diester phosphodiesterase